MKPERVQVHPDHRARIVAVTLLLSTLAAYWPVTNHEFINIHDGLYVTENEHIRAGLTPESIFWAFTSWHAGNWHPLAWLSHLLDVQLFGLRAGWHHLTNLLFHLANTVLLFAVLNGMTGKLWRSALVAALFALHPLHVESVAWVAERKDVLSTFFWMLTLWAYGRYAGNGQGATRQTVPQSGRGVYYALALVFYALGLMSKPMLVTLPFVMLLLDYWPLGRFGVPSVARQFSTITGRTTTFRSLICEKAPFLVLAALSCVVTYRAQESSGAVASWDALPFLNRLANAAVSYTRYLRKTFWPTDLVVFYPLPPNWPAWLVGFSVSCLVALTLALAILGRQRRYLLVGWLWFLGTFVPVIGLVQVGTQAMADRYTYVPLIGLFILLIWGVAELTSNWQRRRTALTVLTVTILTASFVTTRFQVGYWKNNETLWAHAVKVAPTHGGAHHNLALVLAGQGKYEQAYPHFAEAARLLPFHAKIRFDWGNFLAQQGRLGEATNLFAEAVKLQPDYAQAHFDWANALALIGELNEAENHFLEAIRLDPQYAEACNNYGNLLASQGRLEQAIARYKQAIMAKPIFAQAHYGLGCVYARQNKIESAVAHFREALKIEPGLAMAANDLAWILATQTNDTIRNVEAAIRLARRACDLTTNQEALYLDTLGVAYSEAGRFAEAVAAAEHAIAAAKASGDQLLATQLERRLDHYRVGHAYHEIVERSRQ